MLESVNIVSFDLKNEAFKRVASFESGCATYAGGREREREKPKGKKSSEGGSEGGPAVPVIGRIRIVRFMYDDTGLVLYVTT